MRVALKNYKPNVFLYPKHLNNNLTSVRQKSINLSSSRYCERIIERNALFSGTAVALTKNRYPTSFLPSTRQYSRFQDDESDDDDFYDINDPKSNLPATVVVPEVWPHLPVIAISGNPVFPRFMKIVEVSDPVIMKILRRKLELRQPYAGLFVKRDKTNEKETVEKLSDIYDVGTFCRIQEFQDLGDRLRMIVIAYRRIRIVHQLYEEIEPPKSEKKTVKINVLGKELNVSKESDDQPSKLSERGKKKGNS